MPRKPRLPPPPSLAPPQAAALPAVHEIRPGGVYFPDDVRRLFRLRRSSLRREIREKRLRVARVCGRYVFTGEMLLEWIAAAELRRPGGGANHHGSNGN